MNIISITIGSEKTTAFYEDGSSEVFDNTEEIMEEFPRIVKDIAEYGYSEYVINPKKIEQDKVWKEFESLSDDVKVFCINRNNVEKVTEMINSGATIEEVKSLYEEDDINSSAMMNQRQVDDDDDTEFDSNYTMVAVVKNKIVVPSIERIKSQFKYSIVTQNTTGLLNFLEKFEEFPIERTHNIMDLMRFLEKGDLPFTDDGFILAYKRLRRIENGYVDCHSQKVKQMVGSRVEMDTELVDDNRNVDCSRGLHVARRAYIGGFGGDATTLVRVNPLDVVSVPVSDSNKMRVRAYHIIAQLTPEQEECVFDNRPLDIAPDGKELIYKAMHTVGLEPCFITHIGGNEGSNLTYSEVHTDNKLASVEGSYIKGYSNALDEFVEMVNKDGSSPAVVADFEKLMKQKEDSWLDVFDESDDYEDEDDYDEEDDWWTEEHDVHDEGKY